ncbi:MAG: hypothetical protein JSV27_02550 [Candidatus Bathyarchaeota archaeon]|nr:MAG: hypothetical protein JSV27_02550 [Candidatus Bathyarchaeota archaeon]
MILEPIGTVRSPVTEEVDKGWGVVTSEILIDETYTPVLDLKPYFPQYDSRDAHTPRWVDELMESYF